MFIQTAPTPNPASLKFLPGVDVTGSQSPRHLETAEEAAGVSPLAERLFAIAGVSGVFLGQDFITVTKTDESDWTQLKPPVLGAIMEHFIAKRPVLIDTAKTPAATSDATGEDSAVVGQIKELLDTRVRPAVAQDGGDIVFHDFKDGIVFLHLQGACAGCPSSTMTLKSGIERLLTHFIPEVQEVQAV